jgi:hypothetical protein
MKISQVLQSVLLGIIVLGLFAIMAQNSYGFKLMGMSYFGLAILYLIQFSLTLHEDFSRIEKNNIVDSSELLLLASMFIVFGLRAFFINIPFIELIFITLCSLLLVVYFIFAKRIFNATINVNPGLARNLIFFYSSILLFILSLGFRFIFSSLSTLIGTLGILASLPFLISLLRNKQYSYSGKSLTLFQYIVSSRNKAGMLFLFFIFSAIYLSLSNFRIIPGIENAEKPRTYIELRTQAETGKEKPVNGKYKYQIYKEAMDKFLARHGHDNAK